MTSTEHVYENLYLRFENVLRQFKELNYDVTEPLWGNRWFRK